MMTEDERNRRTINVLLDAVTAAESGSNAAVVLALQALVETEAITLEFDDEFVENFDEVRQHLSVNATPLINAMLQLLTLTIGVISEGVDRDVTVATIREEVDRYYGA